MADDNVIRRPVTSSSDVAQRMGELVQRADASKSVVEEAATSLVSEVDKMTKQIGVFQDYLEEIRELGGNVALDGNGTGASMVLNTPDLVDAVKEQTEQARETRETFATLQEKVAAEESKRIQRIDSFVQSLDEDRRKQAEAMRQRDEDFYDKMSNVVRQGSATAQQNSFDRLMEAAQGPSTADTVMKGASIVSDVAQGATSVIGALGAGGTRGMGTIANVLSKAGGVLKFLGPVGAVLGTAVAGLNLVESGIDQFQGLKNASLEATGSTGNLNVGLEQGMQSKLTEFTTNLSDKDVQTIQQGLMKGGATYGGETYGQGYDWVVNATQERGLSAQAATDEYVKAVVKGGKSVDYLNEKFDALANVAESTGASLSAIQQQEQDFAKTMGALTGSSTEADAVGVDLTRFFGDASGNNAMAANGFISANASNPLFQQNVSQNMANGMDMGQAYAAAIQQTAAYAAQTKGGDVEGLVNAVMSGDRDRFKSIVNSLNDGTLGIDGMAKVVSVQRQLASLFGMQQLPMSITDDPDGVFDMLSDVLVGGANRAQQESMGDEGVTSMLDRAKELGGGTEETTIQTYDVGGPVTVSAMSNFVSGLDMDGKKGDEALKAILGKDYGELSDDEKAVFMQAMELSGVGISAKDMAGMTDEGMQQMFNDTKWSYDTYGGGLFGQKGASAYLQGMEWNDKDKWYGYSTGDSGGEDAVALTVRWEDDADKLLYIKAMRGKEQMQSDGDL